MTSQAREAKSTLRKSLKARLAALSSEAVTKQSLIAQKLILSLPSYQAARRVGIYLSMPRAEAGTDLLVRHALAEGEKDVFVPYMHSLLPGPKADGDNVKGGRKRVMEMFRLLSLAEYEGLERDRWEIPYLPHDSVAERENATGEGGCLTARCEDDGVDDVSHAQDERGGLDLIIVPGVAFDTEMNRLGHGAGFYDRFLTRFCAGGRQKPILVGLCLAEQVLAKGEIVMQEWDWRVDCVAVGDGRLLRKEGSEA